MVDPLDLQNNPSTFFISFFFSAHFTHPELPSKVESQLEERQKKTRQNKVLKKL